MKKAYARDEKGFTSRAHTPPTWRRGLENQSKAFKVATLLAYFPKIIKQLRVYADNHQQDMPLKEKQEKQKKPL